MAVLCWVIFGWNGRRYVANRDVWDDREDRKRRDVTPGRNRGRGPRTYRRPDARVYEDVCERLMLDDDLDATEIEVYVDKGNVLLMGSVATRPERRIAEAIVESTPGVTDVDNQLRIGQPAATAEPRATQASADSPS
ncbi:MAG TPA: BON domain-containing protein [Polyangiales bacterium]|nr:BON domain-containing protein [Polyangiales bacterium]